MLAMHTIDPTVTASKSSIAYSRSKKNVDAYSATAASATDADRTTPRLGPTRSRLDTTLLISKDIYHENPAPPPDDEQDNVIV